MKTHHIKNLLRRAALPVLLAGLCSCVNAVEDYYSQPVGNVKDATLKEYLASQSKYSAFTTLLRETGQDKILDGKQLYTVWAPTNAEMPDLAAYTDSMKLAFVQNHLSRTIFYSRNFKSLRRVQMLNGKTLDLAKTTEEDEDGGYRIDRHSFLTCDILCNNGVVHEVDGFMPPRQNIMQAILGLGEEFNIFRDSLLARNVVVFDKENSRVTGLAPTGEVLYDSIFITTNDVLNRGKLDVENNRFTCFIPNNQCLEEAIAEIKGRLDEAQYPYVDEEDTLVYAQNLHLWMDWVMKASIHSGNVDYVAGADTAFTSVHGNELRIPYQEVVDSISCSNGKIYVLGKSRIPISLYTVRTRFNPYFIRFSVAAANPATNPSPYDEGLSGSYFLDDAKQVWFAQFEKLPMYYAFTTCEYTEEKGLDTLRIMPGTYSLYVRLLKNWRDADKTNYCDRVNIQFDDQDLGWIEGVTQNLFGATALGGLVTDSLVIDGTYRTHRIRYGVEGSNATPEARISASWVTLVPTEDNY